MWALCFLFITILLYILYFIISQCDKAAKNYRNTINELHKACFVSIKVFVRFDIKLILHEF